MTGPAGSGDLAARVAAAVADVPDFPTPGVLFKDLTPLLADPALLRDVAAAMAAPWRGRVDHVAGLEARGLIFGTAVALALGAGFVPIRKAGRLPRVAAAVDYDLEYGSARIELPAGVLSPGDRVLVVDDVLATGGTAAAAARLVTEVGAEPVGLAVLLEIAALGGAERLSGLPVEAVLSV